MYRIGHGYDIHRLVDGRPLILGGERIQYHYGLEGHSDADVVLHALGDALLGALAMGDLGKHFPPKDPQWKDADSAVLLAKIVEMVVAAGYRVVNCDLTVIADAPRLWRYRARIRKRIAAILDVGKGDVGFKATTNEGLGAIGRREGIAANAVVLLEKVPD